MRSQAPLLTGITFERVIIRFAFDRPMREPPHLSSEDRYIPLDGPDEGGRWHVNVAAAGGRSFIEPGDYRIACAAAAASEATGGAPGSAHQCGLADDLAKRLPEIGKVWRFGGKYALTVDFTAERTDAADPASLTPVARVRYMRTDPSWKRRRSRMMWGPAWVLSALLGTALYRSLHLLDRTARLLTRHPPKRVLFMSEASESIDGNLKAVADKMQELGLDRHYEFLYSARIAVEHRRRPLSWLRATAAAAKSDYIFLDNHAALWSLIRPADDTSLVQVWHAGIGFKSVGMSRFGMPGSPYPRGMGHRHYFRAIAPAPEFVPVYAEAFGMRPDEILPVGLPRLDASLDEARSAENARARVLAHLGDDRPQRRRLILFAPTFRGANQRRAYYDWTAVDLKMLDDGLDEDSALLLRQHHYVRGPVPIEGLRRVFDLSEYPSPTDLLLASDVLITDYSSISSDFALLGRPIRPILFYVHDLAEYVLTRGVHVDVREEAPGRVCGTTGELLGALASEEYGQARTAAFAERLRPYADGRATERLVRTVFKEAAHEP